MTQLRNYFSSIFAVLRAAASGSHRDIRSLDGLRAISIAFVFLGHLAGTRNFPITHLELGNLGVRIFFVISGFLITSLLMDEIAKTGTVHLARFYFRRTVRLFPASYVLIALIALAAFWGKVTLQPYDLLFATTYTMNYYEARGWHLGHLWSLAVEEQFYLFWPLTLRVLGIQRGLKMLVVVVLVSPFLRLISPYMGVAGTGSSFLLVADALAVGCLLAGLRRGMIGGDFYRRLITSPWVMAAPFIAIAANFGPSTKLRWLLWETIMNISIAITVDWAIRNPDSRAGRFLNLPAIRLIGVLSYSLYLWQQPFLNRECSGLYCAFPVNLLLAVGAGMLSFLFVETPFLRLRSIWEKRFFGAR